MVYNDCLYATFKGNGMARDIRDADDEIDLVALVLLFWGHRGKFAALAVTG